MKPESRKEVPELRAAVGIGASAGGLDALKGFLDGVPPDSGLAYIIVMHMHPDQPSVLPDLLQSHTKMEIVFARDEEKLTPNRVYVIPPGRDAQVSDSTIHLTDRSTTQKPLLIDVFLRSLAADLGGRAFGVILSGTGTDGSLGVKEIKSRNGLVLAQTEATAQYTGMPRSAVRTGCVDRELAPAEMGRLMVEYLEDLKPGIDLTGNAQIKKEDHAWLNKIYAMLISRTGHDFSGYKESTILRRSKRRMSLHSIDSPDTYIKYLADNPVELEALCRDFMIGVTSFFREAEAFEVLKNEVLLKQLRSLEENADFRVWVPACSTGEDVYSLIITLQECLDECSKRVNIQFFGTDINSQSIEWARIGEYPANIEADVSADRLKRYFNREEGHYRIRKDLREKAVFSTQDVLRDPPFSKIDLLCCRNLLIYMKSEVQQRLVSLFHYTLNPGGVLFLGSSETIGKYTNLFSVVQPEYKLYRRKEVPPAFRGDLFFPTGGNRKDAAAVVTPSAPRINLKSLTERTILEKVAPTSVLVDHKGFILHVHGRTGKYLENVSGPPTQNIFDMAREGLRIDLTTAIRKAHTNGEAVTVRNVRVKTNGDYQTIDLHVLQPEHDESPGDRFLVVFEDKEVVEPRTETPGAELVGRNEEKMLQMEQELQRTRESHQTTIEELESANEELKSTNEEMQSSNEELQSSNEELESSKEELQSLNEELQTVNSELQSKVDELSIAHDDMHNLLNSIEVAAVFVDNHVRIKRYTQKATSIIKLIKSDIGRPLDNMMINIEYAGLIDDIEDVIHDLRLRQKEVRSNDGTWYHMRILPYRTTDNRIDGAVVTFLDVDSQKKTQEELEKTATERDHDILLIQEILDMHPIPLCVLDKNGDIVLHNRAFRVFVSNDNESSDMQEIGGRRLSALLSDYDVDKDLDSILGSASMSDGSIYFSLRKKDSENAGERLERTYHITGRTVKIESDARYRILLSFQVGASEGETG